MKSLLSCIAAACAGIAAQGAVVNVQMGPSWCAVTNAAPVLSWDWSWEWVPAAAVRARVVVSGGVNGRVHDALYARPESSAAISLPVLSVRTEDVYTATLSFLDAQGGVLASKTANLDVLCGAFPSVGAEVRTAALDSIGWEKANAPRIVVPYPEGYAVVRGQGRVLLDYTEPGAETPEFLQYVVFPLAGISIIVR